MTALAASLSHPISRRGGAWLVIAFAHAAAIYAICNVTYVRAMFEPEPIEASIIDVPAPETPTPPPDVPQMASITPVTIDPPLVALTEEPAPNAITVAVNDAPAAPALPHAEAAPRAITDVAYLQPPEPKYPPESRRSGEEGLVVLRVLIDELGRAIRVDVERSSGFPRLDDAARAAVERALFRPYVENGVARRALATIPVEFTWKSRGRSRRS